MFSASLLLSIVSIATLVVAHPIAAGTNTWIRASPRTETPACSAIPRLPVPSWDAAHVPSQAGNASDGPWPAASQAGCPCAWRPNCHADTRQWRTRRTYRARPRHTWRTHHS